MRNIVMFVLALSALFAAGCTRVPTSGPIVVVTQRNHGAERRAEIQPLPPLQGARPELVIQGFLTAMAEGRGDYSIARQYLTSEAATNWNPREILIYSDDNAPSHISDGVAHLKLSITGRVDERGTFTRTTEQRAVDLAVVRNAQGEWRIATPPQSLVLAESLFQQAFSPLTLYFFDRSNAVLIPDTFYVPAATINPTLIISQLLRGPAAWTTTMVRSAVPYEMTLGQAGVVLGPDGTATIDVSSHILQFDELRKRQLLAQITASLDRSHWSTQQRVRSVRLISGTLPVTLPDQDSHGAVPISMYVRYLSTSAQVSRELFGISTDNNLYHLRDLVSASAQRDPIAIASPVRQWSNLAVSRDASEIALLNGDASRLYTAKLASAPIAPAEVLAAPSLLRPQYTRFDDLWTMSVSGKTTTVYRVVDGEVTVVNAPALEGIAVSTFSISPDGVRMAVVGLRGGKTVLGEVQLLRDTVTVSVNNFRPMQIESFGGSKAVLDIDWRSDTKLMALSVEGESSQQRGIYELDESSVSLRQVTLPTWDPTAIVTSPYGEFMAVGIGADRRLFRRFDDTHWRLYSDGFKAVAFPG